MRTVLSVLSLFCGLVPALALANAVLPEADMKGARDPAGLARYEGSLIVEYRAGAYDEIALPASALELVEPEQRDGMNNRVFAAKDTRMLEGTLTRSVYLLPPERTPLEAVRNYQQAIEEAGGQRLFECRGDACGGDTSSGAGHGGGRVGIGDLLFPKDRIDAKAFSNPYCAVTTDRVDPRYTILRVERGGVETHVAVLAWTAKDGLYCKAFDGRTFALVVTLEAKPREQKMVTVKAADLGSAIASGGKVALYGILFDFDQATLRPDSAAQLGEIAALLNADPALKLMVVGHTDNVGGAAHNLELSQRRADAVVAALAAQHGIAAERLLAQGMGSASPLASNDSEDGRARNRRVELVKQ